MRSILSLACLFAIASCPRARAGSLDEELVRQMPAIIETLKKDKVKNVGVMPFRVREEGKDRLDTPMCRTLAERLENLFVVGGSPDESAAMGVIQGAGQVASRAKVGAWSVPAERAKLFRLRYPLMWGESRVEPDVFLTGTLELGKNGERTTLTIESFDRDQPSKLRTVATFRVPTDRSILRDLGHPIDLSDADRQALAGLSRASAELEDEKYVASHTNRKKAIGDPNDIAGIVFQVLVDGKPVPCEKRAGRWTLVCPSPEAKVTFRLINRAGKKRAVAVRLNGVNTTDERRDEPELCKKWLTEPKNRYTIDGFYLRGEKETKLSPFRILVGQEADAARREFRDAAGWIDVDVYEEGNAPVVTASLFAPRGLPPSKEKEARASYLALRSALLKSAKLKTQTVVKNDDGLLTKREIIVADKDALRDVEPPDEKDFPNPRLLSRLTIRVIPGK